MASSFVDLNIQHQTEKFGVLFYIKKKKKEKECFTSRAFMLIGQCWSCGPMRAFNNFHANGAYIADGPMLAGNNSFIQRGLMLLTGNKNFIQIGLIC